MFQSKFKHDDDESTDVKEVVLESLVKLKEKIMEVHTISPSDFLLVKQEVADDHIDIVKHDIEAKPMSQLSENIILLEQRTTELASVFESHIQFNTSEVDRMFNTSEVDCNIDKMIRARVMENVSDTSARLTEQISILIQMYKSEEGFDSIVSKKIRKKITKITKCIQSIPIESSPEPEQTSLDQNETFYLSATDNLAQKLSLLTRKLNKLRKIYLKHRNNKLYKDLPPFINAVEKETEQIDSQIELEKTKKRKHMNENNRETMNADDESNRKSIKKSKKRKASESKAVIKKAKVFLDDDDASSSIADREETLIMKEMIDNAHETEELSDQTKEKLRQLAVLITWKIPEAHQVEKRLSASRLPEEMEVLKKLGVKFTLFTKQEDEIIMKNWNDFCQEHDLANDPRPFLSLRHSGKLLIPYQERKKFVQFLGRHLENRSLSSIYRRFKILFRRTKTGRFTKEEDEMIMKYMNTLMAKQKKFAPLVPVLNRSINAIQTRYAALTKNDHTNIQWDLAMKQTLLETILKVMKLEDYKDLRYLEIPKEVFVKVAKKMNIKREKVKTHWFLQLYNQLFGREYDNLQMIKIKIIHLMDHLDLTDWRNVDWNVIASKFNGYSKQFLSNIVKMSVRYNVPVKIQKDLEASLKYLKEFYSPRKRPNAMKFLVYKNGRLQERKPTNNTRVK